MSADADTLALRADVQAGPETFTFRTAEGLHSPGAFREAELALLETLWDRDLGALAVVEANYGLVGTVLSYQAERVHMTDSSARAVRFSRENAARNGAKVTVSLLHSPGALQTRVETCCHAPHGYTPIDVGKQRVIDGLSVLEPGGQYYLVARKSDGLNRYWQCLERHCSTVEAIDEIGDLQVLAGTRPDRLEAVQFVDRQTVRTRVEGTDLSIVTEPGLFSPSRLDDGTRLLLEATTLGDGQRVLDLCCGCGPIGAYAAAVANADVVLTDDCVRATACAKRTLERTGVMGTVVTADCARRVDGPFDRILCNPPTHAGDGVLRTLFDRAGNLLARDGELIVVHHRGLDLDALLSRSGRIIERITGPVHTVVRIRKP